jgi:copper oxidase (laccase) domain-containing protein
MKLFEKSLDKFQIEIYNDLPDFDFFHLKQVHGNDVFSANELKLNELMDGDGIIIDLNSLHPVTIKTADCVPIYLIGTESAAVLHAGWQGLAKSIISNQKVQAIAPQTAFIGPCIHEDDYEVGADFTKNFPNSDAFVHREGRISFNLIEEAAKQIKDCYNIDPDCSLAENTFSHPELNSWRENKTDKRNYNILKIK